MLVGDQSPRKETAMANRDAREKKQDQGRVATEETYVKAMGLLGETGTGGNVACIDSKDGKIIRIRPLHYDWKYDQHELHPWKIEARGKTIEPPLKSLLPPHSIAYKKRVDSPNRILHPLKRVDWDPKGAPGSSGPGGRNPQNRGKSKYVRISWDEATDIIASEISKVVKDYGPEAILAQCDGHGETKIVHPSHACNLQLLNHLGGYTLQARNPDSWEGWVWGAKHAWGNEPLGLEDQTNIYHDVANNTELLVTWGGDPETTTWGWAGQMTSQISYWFTELGMTQIYVCPDLNYGAAVHADKWIPILPNTDAAMRLAIAYVWITEGTYDRKYVDTHTHGFDKFEAYVLGEEDGVPKTPKWASEKTGVPSRTIKALARVWAKKRTSIAHMMGGGSIRGPYSSEPARLEVCLLAMQGLGKPGSHQLLWGILIFADPPRSLVRPNPMFAYRGSAIPQQTALAHGMSVDEFTSQWRNYEGKEVLTGRVVPPIRTPTDAVPPPKPVPKQMIPKNLIHDALLSPPISWQGTTLWAETIEDQFVEYKYPAEGCSEVHMIWTDSPCWITCWNDSNSYMKALQSEKIEFILAQHPWMENDCRFADIILPVSTKLEQDDIGVDGTSGQFDTMFIEDGCTGVRGESVSDREAVAAIAEKLGLLEEYTEGKTAEELRRFGFDNSGIEDLITYDELKERKYFVIPVDPEWKPSPPPMNGFYEDPEGLDRTRGEPRREDHFCQSRTAPASDDVQPRPVANTCPARRHQLVSRDRDLQGEGTRWISL
jgi:trimethylamine-N-oxide reductase (cytochrome c)